MSSLTDSAPVFRYHRDMIALHGNNGSAALGWKNLQSQTVRFKVLSEIADLNGHLVLDAGCGHGDLRAYLHPLYPEINYTGIEQIPELLNVAIKRYAHWPKTNFIEGNFTATNLAPADYILASGSLNYYSKDPQYIFSVISKLFENCRLGLGFNLLSQIRPNGLLVAYNPDEILNYCKSMSKKVILRDDYDDEDFTIFMYH